MNRLQFLITLIECCVYVLAFSSNPPLYAVDVGDGNGLILLKKLSLTCPQYYKSVRETDSLILRFSSGQSEITLGTTYQLSQSSCGLVSETGTKLFIYEGEGTSNGSWVNVQTKTSTTNVSVYALEDCTTYEGVFINGDF